MSVVGLILAAAILAPAAAPGAGETERAKPAPEAVSAAEKPAKPKKVCVVETQLGSHFKTRICATPEEWDRRRLADEAAMARAGDRGAACTRDGC